MPVPESSSRADEIRAIATETGIGRIHVLAWRDLDDPEAGGSERHLHEVARVWASAGLDVHVRTSFAAGHRAEAHRSGYRITRRAGRYLIFPRAVAAEVTGRHGRRDALVEVWNGMPFFSPLWARGPRLTLLHHVHGEMWRLVLPPWMAAIGEAIEGRVAPPLYRHSRIATLSASSARTIASTMAVPEERITVVAPGVDGTFTPGGSPAACPTVLTVGRLVPSKRVDRLVRTMAKVRAAVPDVRLEIVGEGYEEPAVRAAIAEVDGESWISLAGWVGPTELRDRYRRAWVLASASTHEGWGMAITEAAACGTPAVVTDVEGHCDAVLDGRTGVLTGQDAMADRLVEVLTRHEHRAALGAAARQRAATLRWEDTAAGLLGVLADGSSR